MESDNFVVGPHSMSQAMEQTHVLAIGHYSNYRGGNSHATCIGDYTESQCEWDIVVGETLFGIPIPNSVKEFVYGNASKARCVVFESTMSSLSLHLDNRQLFSALVRDLWEAAGESLPDFDLIMEIP